MITDTADKTTALHFNVDMGGHEEFNAATEGVDVNLLILSNHSLAQVHADATAEGIETGTTNESVTLQISQLLYIEAVGNYVKVSHLRDNQVHADMLRATMKQMEETLQDYPMIVRCHRAFLVNLSQVEQIISHSGSTQLIVKHCHESLPVSRSNMAQVRAAIKQG